MTEMQTVPATDTVPFPVIEGVQVTTAPSQGGCEVTLLTIEGEERSGRLLEICDDLDTVRVEANPAPMAGEAVVFYLDSGMRFVATCAEVDGDVATLRLKLSHHRSAGRRGQSVRPLRDDADRRSIDDACTLHDGDGTRFDCRVLDISLTGLFVATEAPLQVGEMVRVGRAAAEIIRIAPGGYGMRLVRAGTRPVPNPAAKLRADRFAAGRAPVAAVA